jgi:hypothetical protein
MSQVLSGSGAVAHRAVSLMVNRTTRFSRCAGLVRALVLVAGAVVSTACADSLTAPVLLDDAVVQRVLPSVEDARLRMSTAIENAGVRERVLYDLAQLEVALIARDAQRARYHVRLAGGILLDYHASLGLLEIDGADVGGIALSLHQTAIAVGGGFDISAFK